MKRIKGNIKLIIGVAIGILISVVTSYTLAETLIKSADVSYVDNSKLGATNVQAAIDGTCTKFSNDLATILDKMYPIGSIYISTTLSTPAQVGSAIGGTWASYGVGKTLLSSTTSEQTGGSNTVTLKETNLPAHTHDISHTHTTPKTITSILSLTAETAGKHNHELSGAPVLSWPRSYDGTKHWGYSAGVWNQNTESAWSEGVSYTTSTGEHSHNVTGNVTIPTMTTDSISATTSGSTGSGTSFSVQNPYITVYMYKRTK